MSCSNKCSANSLFFIFTEWCLCMKDLKIQVPAAVERGHDATLNCMFDLDGDRLYSVKWYRGSGEFYRYTPSESPKVKQFKIKVRRAT